MATHHFAPPRLGHAGADNLEHDVAVKEGAQNVSLLGLGRFDQGNWLD